VIGPEITRLVDLAARVGDDLDEIAGRLRAPKAERTALEARLRELEVVDVEALRPRIEAQLVDLGWHQRWRRKQAQRHVIDLAEGGRDALRALLRGERLRVTQEPRAGYRVGREGLAAAAGGRRERPGPAGARAYPCVGRGGALHAQSVFDLPVRIAS
jgi:hypothetical protein